MACWVVPSIAAEFWRVPLDHVMDQIRRNAVPVRRENGFTFVDILPDPQTGEALPPEQRPPTYVEAGPREEVSGVRVEANPEWVSQNRVRLKAAASRRAPVHAAS